ncbi:DUF6443 domain-containing protein [Sphingobacterium anhuiense]|uniref:DUF6443 domain-containing protein n=1 Tax=Sphingobacterium anhuiense TaxID=493780 RepID=UPI003C2D9D84
MKRHISTIIAAALSLSAQSQVLPRDTSLSAYTTGQTSIQALGSITLKNGFHIPVQPSGKSVTISIVGVQNLLSQPSVGQNYILTKIFKKPGVTLTTLNIQRTIGEENQTVQYFDGLGRPLQTVQLMASPTYKDIVQHIEYDGFGRESTKYLPYAHSQGNGSYKTGGNGSVVNFYSKTSGSDIDGVVRTAKPFSVTVFENSPLNRVQEQGAPGVAWQPVAGSAAGHTVKTVYGTNTATEVKLWEITYSGTVPIGAKTILKYGAGKLYKIVTKDENWVSGKGGTVEEFKDFEGRVVLKRVWKGEAAADALDTYYVYDDFGSLCYVVPPLVTATFLETAPSFTNYVYAYRYDGRRRLIEKKIPGKGWEWLVYNENDQVILTQDALQRSKQSKEWSYTKYDVFGRVVESGKYIGNYASQSAAQTEADKVKLYWEERSVPSKKVGTIQYTKYTTNRAFPNGSGPTPLVVNYYDDYYFDGGDTTQLKPFEIVKSDKIKSLQTGSLVYKDDGTLPILSINYYDDYGRLIQSAGFNHIGGKDYVTNGYSFVGELQTSKRVHTPVTGSATTILTTNEYDHVGRHVETKKRVNTLSEIIQSKFAYNEVGQLKQKNLHVNGSTVAQEIVYGYNERGWLSKINNPAAVTAKQVFGMELSYANKADTYNGNIGTMKWNTKVNAGMTQQPVQTYTYSYDKLNRLSRGSYINAGAAAVNKEGFYDEELRYDNMGNIDSLRRTSGSKTWSNNFKYTYSGHKLSKVTDVATPARTNSFAYDVNGNATTNTRLGITKIEYNYINLPIRFIKGVDTLVYKYDGLGQKLTKKLGIAKTDYINGIQYKNGVIEFIQTEEGRILPNNGSYIYEYFLEDHLGNTRAIVDQSGSIKQIQDYYPFGMEMNQGNSLNTASNLYKYNGKEKQVEMGLDQLDYGARFYDAEIGRWNVVDPLAEKYGSSTPYNYVDNNPIIRIDPNGMDWIFSISKNKNGEMQINLTYYTAVMNSSGKSINMSNFMENQKKEFASVFGQGNVNAKLLIREVNSVEQLNDFESLIDIQSSDKFRLNADGSYVGGDTNYGGKFIRLNSKSIDNNGALIDKKTLVHEIGHTGGLIHTFEPNEKALFPNGKSVSTNMQQFNNHDNNPYYEANFMNYTQRADANTLNPNINAKRFFMNTVGKGTRGQLQTIINNLYDGNLNHNNIPKKNR